MLRPAKTLLTIATIAIVASTNAAAKPAKPIAKSTQFIHSLAFIKDHQRQIDMARIADASLDATGDTSPTLIEVCNETASLPDNAYGNAIIESCMRLEL